MRPEVIKAIEEASSVFVDLEELHETAGDFVSNVCSTVSFVEKEPSLYSK